MLPKLGRYHGRESEIPYDYPDLIRLIAPRKVLVYAPLRDRFADPEDIRIGMKEAQMAWTRQDGFTFMAPDDVCRFQTDQQEVLVEWLNQVVK